MKPASSLTASLLARKGQAAPALGPRSVAHTLSQETVPDPKQSDAVSGAVLETKDTHDQNGTSEADTGSVENDIVGDRHGVHAETLAKLEDALIEKALERGMAHAGDDDAPADTVRHKIPAKPKAQVGEGDRIAMTVRLSHDEHLKLKVFAAHTKISSQQIFKMALESFMTKSAPKSLKTTCLCFGEKK